MSSNTKPVTTCTYTIVEQPSKGYRVVSVQPIPPPPPKISMEERVNTETQRRKWKREHYVNFKMCMDEMASFIQPDLMWSLYYGRWSSYSLLMFDIWSEYDDYDDSWINQWVDECYNWKKEYASSHPQGEEWNEIIDSFFEWKLDEYKSLKEEHLKHEGNLWTPDNLSHCPPSKLCLFKEHTFRNMFVIPGIDWDEIKRNGPESLPSKYEWILHSKVWKHKMLD